MSGNIKLLGQTRGSKSKVRYSCFIKIFCLQFLGLGFLLDLPQSDFSLWSFHGDSYFSMFWGMWNLTFEMWLLCKAMHNFNKMCKWRVWTKVCQECQYWVLGTLKNYFSGILHSFFKIALFFSFHKLKLDDFSNSRANKRHFENFEQILSTVTLT